MTSCDTGHLVLELLSFILVETLGGRACLRSASARLELCNQAGQQLLGPALGGREERAFHTWFGKDKTF